MNAQKLLQLTIEKRASDLHLSVGIKPAFRIDGDLYQEGEAIDLPTLKIILQELTTTEQLKLLTHQLEIDLAYELSNIARFRVNVFHHQRGLGIAFRSIPLQMPSFESLELPALFQQFCTFHNGLVLVTGATGVGKSSTLAAMINHINEHEHKHIITIEDPIEFIHACKNSLIHQRQVQRDTISFDNALRSALREDPDIIMVGELRDLATIRLALTAAETGHLVFATLHTASAAKTIDRMIDVFPAGEKELIRIMLAESLRVVVSQTLIKKMGGGRIPAFEIMVCTPAIRNLIRENKIAQIQTLLQTGQALGMQTMEQHIGQLVAQNKVLSNT